MEMVTSLGGVAPNASRRLTVARRLEYGKLPMQNVVEDTSHKVSIGQVSIGPAGNMDPADNIELRPFDVITAERADMVYVNGEVAHIGGYELGERDYLPVSQIIVLSGGLTREAKPKKAVILRRVLSTNRHATIPVDVQGIMKGKSEDFPLYAGDVLYIPHSNTRPILTRTALIALPVILGAIAYTAFR